MLARYLSTVPLAKAINLVHAKMNPGPIVSEPIPRNHQLMLWWAGLRGAIAFALSFDVEGKAAPAIRTTTLVVCVVSIMILGGTTHFALSYLNIKTGFGASGRPFKDPTDFLEASAETDSSDDGEDVVEEEPETESYRNSMGSSVDNTSEDLFFRSRLSRNRRDADLSHWFMNFDEHYLKPIFTRKTRGWLGPKRRQERRSSASSPTRDQLLPDNLTPSGSRRVFGSSTRVQIAVEPIAAQPSIMNDVKGGESFQDADGNRFNGPDQNRQRTQSLPSDTQTHDEDILELQGMNK